MVFRSGLLATLLVAISMMVMTDARHPSGTLVDAWANADGRNVVVRVSLGASERIVGAVAGDLTDTLTPAIVVGTSIGADKGRALILHEVKGRYGLKWQFMNSSAVFDGAMVRDVNNNRRQDLITLWRRGQGGYLDAMVFEWDGRTYRSIWELLPNERRGQLTAAATLQVKRIDAEGGVEVIIRAPNVLPGASTLGALPHQVSIYRWSKSAKTLVLYRRFVERDRSYD